jgi:xanthine dehydrogenase accessory factor
MRNFFAEITEAISQGRPCVYCTVIETRGSTPQKAGAAMLVFPDGSQEGTLGGGCVEAEVKRRALQVLEDGGHPEVLSYYLDDNYGWDDGLICGGRMRILADPLIDRGRATSRNAIALVHYYQQFESLLRRGEGCVEAVVLDPSAGLEVGNRYLFAASANLVAQLGPGCPTDELLRNLPALAERPASTSHHGVAYLPILPRITLLVVGGGHVGQAVARLAGEVDFTVWVLDDREAYANRARFPAAEQVLVGDIGPTLKDLSRNSITASTFCLIMTRGHAHDEEALYHLAASSAAYVGMIGSKRKIKLIYEDLLARNVPTEALARVHAPLGLDIGSKTVPEIAISIVAELIACRNLGTARIAKRTRFTVEKQPS